jgi:putative flippase GtrA
MDNIELKKKRRHEAWMAFKYLLFAASAGLIEIGSFTLLNELTGLPYWPSYLIALTLSIIWNFTFNRRYTFKSANNVPKAMVQYSLSILCLHPYQRYLVNISFQHLAGMNIWLPRSTCWPISFLNSYINVFYVFKQSIDTNDLAKREAMKKEGQVHHLIELIIHVIKRV